MMYRRMGPKDLEKVIEQLKKANVKEPYVMTTPKGREVLKTNEIVMEKAKFDKELELYASTHSR